MSIARWNLKEAEGKTPGLTNRNHIEALMHGEEAYISSNENVNRQALDPIFAAEDPALIMNGKIEGYLPYGS